MTFIIDIFQFHCKSEHKQVSEMKLKGASANLTVLPYLQSIRLFKALFMRELIYTYSLYLQRKINKKNSKIADEKKMSKAKEEKK